MVAKDDFENYAIGATDPANHAAEITPSDTDELQYVARAIYIGTGGNLKVTTVSGEVVTYKNVPDGCVIAARTRKIWATGTTAADLIAEW